MRERKTGKCCEGFTLVEAVLLVVLIAVAIPPLLRLFGHSILGSVDAELRTKAVFYAQEKLEQILNDKNVAGGYAVVVTPGRYPADSPEQGFQRFVTIDTTGKVYNGVRYARVVVTVRHPNVPDVSLETWLTNY
jgi:Tfp pilus assembly protein PilV